MENNSKTIKVVLRILLFMTIFNIICILISYLKNKAGDHSFNESLSPSTFNMIGLLIIVFVMQVINIVIIQRLKTQQSKILLISAILLTIATCFIPIGGTHEIEYKYDNAMRGTTVHTETYRNLYGITIVENTYQGVGEVY